MQILCESWHFLFWKDKRSNLNMFLKVFYIHVIKVLILVELYSTKNKSEIGFQYLQGMSAFQGILNCYFWYVVED